MEGAWSNCVPVDLLSLILSRLTARDCVAFGAVCKQWRLVDRLPPPSRPIDSETTPCLMTLYQQQGIAEFFYPLYNASYQVQLPPQLIDSQIRCSNYGWLLMSRGEHGMFFFNPSSKRKIELPDLGETNYFPTWSFTCPPDSNYDTCFVVGFEWSGSPPAVYIIKVGDTEWKLHTFYEDDTYRLYYTLAESSPIFFNNTFYVLCDEGKLGILSIGKNAERPRWIFCGNTFRRRKRNSIQQILMAEDVNNEGILAIFLSYEGRKVEVWRYKYNHKAMELEREQITSLDDKTLFVSLGASYLKPCVVKGMGNKIFFPKFHDNNGVVYSLGKGNYYSLSGTLLSSNAYDMVEPRSCIWM